MDKEKLLSLFVEEWEDNLSRILDGATCEDNPAMLKQDAEKRLREFKENLFECPQPPPVPLYPVCKNCGERLTFDKSSGMFLPKCDALYGHTCRAKERTGKTFCEI